MLFFIDSDILLDAILMRQPHHTYAMKLLSLLDTDDFQACTSVHTLLNVHYISSKRSNKQEARKAIRLLIGKLTIISDDREIVEQAIDSNFSDLEDAVQYFAAKKMNAAYIITRNLNDYKLSSIPVLTAEQFLRIL